MGIAIELPTEIDIDRAIDLLLPLRSTADRGMGTAIEPPTEIDIDRAIDLLLPPRSTADRSMGTTIVADLRRGPCHV